MTTPWHLAILDEAQAIKNPQAKQTRAVKKLDALVEPIGQRFRDLQGGCYRDCSAKASVVIYLRGLCGCNRFTSGALAREILKGGHGAQLSRQDRAIPGSLRDQVFMQSPGLGVHVQARRGRVLRHWRGLIEQPELIFKLRKVDPMELSPGRVTPCPYPERVPRKTKSSQLTTCRSYSAWKWQSVNRHLGPNAPQNHQRRRRHLSAQSMRPSVICGALPAIKLGVQVQRRVDSGRCKCIVPQTGARDAQLDS
jgi:hypothetical protein